MSEDPNPSTVRLEAVSKAICSLLKSEDMIGVIVIQDKDRLHADMVLQSSWTGMTGETRNGEHIKISMRIDSDLFPDKNQCLAVIAGTHAALEAFTEPLTNLARQFESAAQCLRDQVMKH